VLIEKGNKSVARRSIDLVRRKLAPQPGGILDASMSGLEKATK